MLNMLPKYVLLLLKYLYILTCQCVYDYYRMQATQKLAGKKKVDLKARLEEEAAAAQEDKEEGLFTFIFCFFNIIIKY